MLLLAYTNHESLFVQCDTECKDFWEPTHQYVSTSWNPNFLSHNFLEGPSVSSIQMILSGMLYLFVVDQQCSVSCVHESVLNRHSLETEFALCLHRLIHKLFLTHRSKQFEFIFTHQLNDKLISLFSASVRLKLRGTPKKSAILGFLVQYSSTRIEYSRRCCLLNEQRKN